MVRALCAFFGVCLLISCQAERKSSTIKKAASSNSNSETSPSTTPKDQKEGSVIPQVSEAQELSGIYLFACDGGLLNEMEFKTGKLIEKGLVYPTEDCSGEADDGYDNEYTAEISPVAGSQGLYQLTIVSLDVIKAAALSQTMVDENNFNAFYGFTDWELGIYKDVTDSAQGQDEVAGMENVRAYILVADGKICFGLDQQEALAKTSCGTKK
jgi:hypothetical protein